MARWWILLHFLAISTVLGVEVHFENKEGGFFLKHASLSNSRSGSGGGSTTVGADPAVVVPPLPSGAAVSVERFTVLRGPEPAAVRATYGPFSTKQTVPARYIVPDPVLQANSSDPRALTHHLDLSAHLVTAQVPQDAPVLRVLFHAAAGGGAGGPAAGSRALPAWAGGAGSGPGGNARGRQRVCVVLHATLPGREPLSAACAPDADDGVCVAQVTIPASWWPPLSAPDLGSDGDEVQPPRKTPPRLVRLAYSVLDTCGSNSRNSAVGAATGGAQLQAAAPLGHASLAPARASPSILRADARLALLLPRAPIYPLSRVHVPVFLRHQEESPVDMFVMRARVKSGVRILGAASSGPAWNITVDLSSKHTAATVTALRRRDAQAAHPAHNQSVEIFTWLLEVSEDGAELWDGARVVWSVRYVPAAAGAAAVAGSTGGGSAATPTGSDARRKVAARLEVHKDDIQAVLPISKNWEVLNTAVLTGRQVSQAMKVLIVSQAGKAADVTLQAACQALDESVLKVSSSCSSVYVDGSEARGSVNGSVLVRYGQHSGLARFTVWMPELPLEVNVPDARLSQIRGWRVPSGTTTTGTNECRPRYQQTPVDVYGRFLAADHESGRVNYLVSRRAWLRVTDLVAPLLRVSDPRLAVLAGRVLRGRAPGRAEVQVLSPITGRVIGAREVRVGSDKVSVSQLAVSVVSGLQLNIAPDLTAEGGFVAETSVTRRLTAQYQEGLLDIELEFSDGARTPLRDVDATDYRLFVESLDTDVVAFAPMVASHHPRVIAVGEGRGDLLKVTLLLNEQCRLQKTTGKPNGLLASASANVEVDFSASDIPHRPDVVQNDGGIPLKDEHDHEPTVQARQHHSIVLSPHDRGITRHRGHPTMTPLEIGMYVLLAAFCFAIVVFVVSCVVYASKFKPHGMEGGTVLSGGPLMGKPAMTGGGSIRIPREPKKPRPTTMNAHDWVWLGRATLERSSVHAAANNNNPCEIRITSNPMNLNYSEPDDCLVTSFDNPNHIELPSRSPIIDSSTYNKRNTDLNSNLEQKFECVSPVPPPVPPHGMTEEYKPPVPPHRGHRQHANRKSGPHDVMDPPNSAFTFDDAPPPPTGGFQQEILQLCENKQSPESPAHNEAVKFVEFPKGSIGNSANRPVYGSCPEIKKATIVGNPMFTSQQDAKLPASELEDLQLDMDYEQIMHYFDNLKESNA